MTSSMMIGERRWASARRSGMTVLGKVAVPKPINLPSQRLENHGLDPNVEIVPKGTLSWGNRSCSSTSNAWGSSSLSPNTDGGIGSPSYVSGRPSSSGSGTRPSTAGSDRAHEHTSNAWGPNSRPSSASGAVTSNQTSLASLRPRSAETRPGSSQLSRFAETLSENSVAWNSDATAERLGVTQRKDEGFSLTTGDFPVLGSEKDSVRKDAESHDHESVRPRSSCGVKEGYAPSVTDDVTSSATAESSTVNSWRRDNPGYGEDGVRSSMEKWPGHSQPYPGTGIPPQHYDAWHCMPVNNPQAGVWYRGPRGGPPFGTPVAPGSFPMEPFPYFHPHIPNGGIPNPQQGPPPGSGPRGPHPKTGDMFRPPMPDAFIRPSMSMSIRPGFYPGPVAYEGYYGPPMGYCNSNERDAPFTGMGPGSSGYNRYLNQNAPDPGNFLGRIGGCGSTGNSSMSEQIDSSHSRDTQRPYRVLLKQNNGLDDKNEEQYAEISSAKVGQPRPSSWEKDWGSDQKKEEKTDVRRRPTGEVTFRASSSQGANSSYTVEVKSHESVGSVKVVDDVPQKKLEDGASNFPEIRQSPPAAPKDPSLIQKIEGLNAKARASDGRHDIAPVPKEDGSNKFRANNVRGNCSTDEDSDTVYGEKISVSGFINPASNEMSVHAGDKRHETGSFGVSPRRSTHGIQNRGERGRGKFNTQEVDRWKKRSPIDGPGVLSSSYPETSNVHVKDHDVVVATEKVEPCPPERHEVEAVQPMLDSSDGHAQRAKMRELAKQRTKQLLEEEEERTRKQRAKALAKLEELNRRAQAGVGPIRGLVSAPDDMLSKKPEECQSEVIVAGNILEVPTSVVASDLHIVHDSEHSNNLAEKLPSEMHLKTRVSFHEEVVVGVGHDQSVPLKQDASVSVAARGDSAPQVRDTLKHKRVSYKQKQNIMSEKNYTEKVISNIVTEAPNIQIEAAADPNASLGDSSLLRKLNPVVESMHARKKSNRSGKGKNKVEEVSLSALSSSVSKATKFTIESGKSKESESETVSTSVQPVTNAKEANQFPDQLPLPNEELKDGGNVQWKSQNYRRMPRNLQNRSVDKFHANEAVIWAPVRSFNKTEATDEASQKNEAEAVISSANIDTRVQNNPKNKRAEMERYVPKPVAKEMAQQGSIQSSLDQVSSDESQARSSSQGIDSAAGNVGPATLSRNRDVRNHKQSKLHGLWQQRGSTELTNGQSLPDQTITKVLEHAQGNLANEQSSYYDEWNPPDGWNNPIPESVPPVTRNVGRDQGVTGRGKRQHNRGNRGLRNNNDVDQKNNSGEDEKISTQSMVTELSQRDFPAASKDNRGIGERTSSHWQPKSQGFSSTNQRGSRSSDGHKESAGDHVAPLHQDQSINEKSIVNGPNEAREAKREKKIISHSGRPHSPNLGPANPVELAPANMDARLEQQRSSSSFPRSGNHNNSRVGRGPESQRDSSSFGQDNKQHNQPAYRERQRNNTHYEYQPVGVQNSNNKSWNYDGPKDSTQQTSSRYRERVQSHSRHGGGNS